MKRTEIDAQERVKWRGEMEERRYVLNEIDGSELRRRLRAIIALEVPGATLDGLAEIAISILLHGEGKEPEKNQCEYATACKDDSQRADYCPLRGTPKDPTETHDEWVERMPMWYFGQTPDEWLADMKQWFREEPR